MPRYRVQTSSGRTYEIDLSEGDDIDSAVAEIEQSEAPAPRDAGGGRGFINPPMAGQPQPKVTAPTPAPIDYGQAATDMMGTPMSAPQPGLIQSIGSALRPAPAPSVMAGYTPPQPSLQARQAELDRRLSYGAGPISADVVRDADTMRNARVTGAEVRFRDPGYESITKRVAGAMDRAGELSSAQIVENTGRQSIRDAVADQKASEFRGVGEWAVDTLSSVAQGVVGWVQLPVNIIAPGSALADTLRDTQKELQAQDSEVAQAFRDVLRRRVESEEGFLGKYVATVRELVTNPTMAINEGLKQLPMFLGVVGAARLGAAAGAGGVAAAGRVAPTVALSDAISGGALTAGARAAGVSVGGIGASMAMAGGDAAGNTYETLTDPRKTPLSEWAKNPDFQRLVESGKTEQEAVVEIATAKARMAALMAAPLGVLGFMGAEAAVAGRGLGRAAAEAATVKGAAKMLGKDNITEQLEEGGTQIAGNLGVASVNQNQPLLQGVPEAMGTAAVLSTPFGALGAYSQYRESQRQQGAADPLTDAYARASLSTLNPDGSLISPEQTRRQATDIGPSAPVRGGIVNDVLSFTPPGSITEQAGLAPIVVPATPGATTNDLGGVNVGLPDIPGGLVGAGGAAGGGDAFGGMGGAGRDPALAGGRGGDAAGLVAGDGAPALRGVGAAQPGPTLTAGRGDRATDADLLARAEQAAPQKIWAGRAGDGYSQTQDAQQALPKLQSRYPDLTWSLQQDADGKYYWAGSSQPAQGDANAAGGIAGAAGQGLAGATGAIDQGQQRPAGAGLVDFGQAGGGRPAVAAGAATVGGTAPDEPAFTLKLAPRAPLKAAGQAITILKSNRGVDVELYAGNLTDQQKVASAMARLVGKTVTYLNHVGGKPEAMPNGFVIDGQDKNIYLDSNSDDGALFVMMHEGVHALPQPIRDKLVTTIKGLTKQEMRADFAQKFGYDLNNEVRVDNEMAAFMTQAVSKREDFWQELRTKMGDGDFIEVAKVILDKLNTFITGARKEYGDDFLQRYATDAVAVRDAVSTAYADAMKAQGKPAPAAAVGPGLMASNRAADVNKLGMYSELARKLDAGPNQAPVDQWKAYIKGLPQKGVKPDEIEWSGVGDFLELKRAAGQKVTKAEVAEYLRQGGVQVEETVLGGAGSGFKNMSRTEMIAAHERIVGYDPTEDEPDITDADLRDRLEGFAREAGESDGITEDGRPVPKYSQYTLPGGENYREVLLTLPVASDKMTSQEINARIQALDKAMDSADGKEWDEMQAERLALKQKWRDSKQYEFRSNHWDQPNVLAHIRLNDRTDAEGKRVLLVEEIQSDWGQEGKKKGFRKQNDPQIAKLQKQREEWLEDPQRRNDVWQINAEINRLGGSIVPGGETGVVVGSIPPAPFVTKTEGWLNLALKRVMIMAAEGGYDRVAFTTGEQNAERFSLDKRLREIAYEPAGDGKYEITATDIQGREVISEDEVGLDRIEELVGKEIAEKVARDEGERDAGGYREWRYLRGDNLKVEAKGMRAFYDTIVPTALKKLLPKVGGGQVGAVSINTAQDLSDTPDDLVVRINPTSNGRFRVGVGAGEARRAETFSTREQAQSWADDQVAAARSGRVSPQPGFDITPAMREKVATSGLPMFSNKAGSEDSQAKATAARQPRRGTEQIGEFDVRTMKDGTIVVYGDAEAIRAQIPEDVKGRVTKDGVLFTTSAAPRVKAALAGRRTAYSRGGAVLAKLPMKDGKYVGAPEKYNTPAKISLLRKSLRKLAKEGERGRFWYENSSREILRMTGGNVQEARKFVALLAIYSPQAKVDANSTFALRAWAQYKAGQPISVKTGVMDAKAQGAMDDVDAFWSGEKTGNFFFNLLREIDPSTVGKQGATIDMWMMRAGEYNSDAPTATQYAFMENETNRLAQELGWEPQQVQAAIWVAMKARMENAGVKKRTEAISEKNGWIRFDYPIKKGRPVKTRVILNAQQHRDNWLRQAFAHTPTAADTEQAKFDFSDGVRRHIGQISWEARPGRSTGVLPGVNDAPYEQQVEFQQAVQKALLDDDGIDLLAYKLGLLVDGPDILAPGVWQGEVAAGMQKLVATAPAKGDAGKTSIDPAQKQALEAYAAVLGLLLRQEGIGYHRPFYNSTVAGANGVNIDIGRPLTQQEAQALWGAVDQRMKEAGAPDWEGKSGMISAPTGIRLVNFGALSDNAKFHALVKSAAQTLPVDGVEVGLFASDGDMVTNNWKESPNGEDYRQRIAAARSPDLLGWTGSVLAPRVQSVFNEFSSRYGWGDPGAIQFSSRAGDGGGRADRAGPAPLPGAPVIQGATGPDPRIVAVAEQYARDNGIDLKRQAEYVQVDPKRAKRIANAYEVMRHAPENPKVKEAYENLIKQTTAQYRALEEAGYKFWFIDPENDPYKSPWDALRDLRSTQTMGVFPTAAGFGSAESDTGNQGNPMEAGTGMFWPYGSPDGELRPVLANDLFRAVHDAFGHGMEGAGFREQGEENAWQAHIRLFTGSAKGAITSETRGQNSWLNYGPYGERNRTAKVEDTIFADQKTGLMPEWTWTEGMAGDEPMFANRAYHGTPARGIDKFSTDFIGTGEGAQAYGWGLYFASKREIAEHYRRRLAGENGFIADTDAAFEAVDSPLLERTGWGFGAIEGDGTYTLIKPNGGSEVNSADAPKRIRAIADKLLAPFINRGQLYEVDIPEDSEMLLWDKPLSEQPKKVREMLASYREPTTLDAVLQGRSIKQLLAWVDAFDRNNSFGEWVEDEGITDPDVVRQAILDNYSTDDMGSYLSSDTFEPYRTGESMYREISAKRGDDRAASEALLAIGIKGIKYLDGVSRGNANYQPQVPRVQAKVDRLQAAYAADPSESNASRLEDAKQELESARRADEENAASYNYVVFSGDDVEVQQAYYSNRRAPVIGRSMTLPATGQVDAARIKLQDDALRMKRVIEAVKAQGGKVGERQNFYDANTLMPGRIQAAVDDFRANIVLPMLEKASVYGIDMDELALYAYAKHAEERNDYIASINPRMPDGGSGMTTADANAILQQVAQSGRQAQYDDLHGDLMAITSTTRQLLLNEGLITQDEFDAMTNAYQNYIPLRGWENVVEETGVARPGVGRGVNVRGKETIRALGRSSRAGGLIENALRDYERVVTRVEKNDVGKVLLDFVLSNPDPDLWGVDVVKRKASFNKAQGVVQFTAAVEKGENTIGVKVGGEQVYIELADPELARALRQAWKDETSGLERATLAITGWWNNWLRATLTRYNPAFAALNIPRDALWSGTSSALAELGPKGLASYLKNFPRALVAAGRKEAGIPGSSATAALYEQFRAAGGITGGFNLRTVDDIRKDLQRDLRMIGPRSRTYPLKAARFVLKALEFLGAASENATRFALYAAAREVGRSTTQAALLAKNGTTNFNRKGEWGGALNNLYLFFNAGVQGTTQLAKVLKSPAVQASMAGVAAVGGMLALYGASAGGEDDDGEAYWDKVPSYVKERNLVLMLPPGEALGDGIERVGKRGRYITLPVQYGFNIFPNMGYMVADVWRNSQDKARGVSPAKAAVHMASVVFGSVNPFGGSVDVTDGVQVLLAAMPTLIDLPVQIATERNAFGAPSSPAKSAFDTRPDSERMFLSLQGTAAQRIAERINALGGGNEAKAGKIMGVETSIAPGTIKTFIGATTGGLGMFVDQMADSFIAMSSDDQNLRAKSMPILNRFYGEVDEDATIRTAAERRRQVDELVQEVKRQRKVGIEPELDAEANRLIDLAGLQEQQQKLLTRLRKDEVEIVRSEMPEAEKKAERKRIQAERDRLAIEFNREFLQGMRQP